MSWLTFGSQTHGRRNTTVQFIHRLVIFPTPKSFYRQLREVFCLVAQLYFNGSIDWLQWYPGALFTEIHVDRQEAKTRETYRKLNKERCVLKTWLLKLLDFGRNACLVQIHDLIAQWRERDLWNNSSLPTLRLLRVQDKRTRIAVRGTCSIPLFQASLTIFQW